MTHKFFIFLFVILIKFDLCQIYMLCELQQANWLI